jgi:hypothetical protein
MMPGLTQDRLKDLLHYDPATGHFTWKVSRSGVKHCNGSAGTQNASGYVVIGIDGFIYPAHRLAWLYVYGEWPKHQIDHINRCKYDNRIANLRDATPSENLHNTGINSSNTSGLKGVSFHKKSRKWQAFIRNNGRNQYLGVFDTPENASKAYLAAKDKITPPSEPEGDLT